MTTSGKLFVFTFQIFLLFCLYHHWNITKTNISEKNIWQLVEQHFNSLHQFLFEQQHKSSEQMVNMNMI